MFALGVRVGLGAAVGRLGEEVVAAGPAAQQPGVLLAHLNFGEET